MLKYLGHFRQGARPNGNHFWFIYLFIFNTAKNWRFKLQIPVLVEYFPPVHKNKAPGRALTEVKTSVGTVSQSVVDDPTGQ